MSAGDYLPVIDNSKDRRNLPHKTTEQSKRQNFLHFIQNNTDIMTPMEQSSISYSQEELMTSMDPKFNRSQTQNAFKKSTHKPTKVPSPMPTVKLKGSRHNMKLMDSSIEFLKSAHQLTMEDTLPG